MIPHLGLNHCVGISPWELRVSTLAGVFNVLEVGGGGGGGGGFHP